ncbi:sigma factor-like helix-turn-helix DNA-binding protein [Actinosynnema sp. NPDC050436]|uniref:RNA polymerase sigma factor n=1 Tax=Actinosynnema sp. NPDC050436 TaxID=3155659 RepID=UPI00340F028D
MEGSPPEPPDHGPDGSAPPADLVRDLGGRSAGHSDEVLVEHLRERGFTDAVWDALRTRLVVYGLGFVTPLIGSGAIFASCRRRGRHLHQQPVLPEDAEELAMDVVQDGLALFAERGIAGRQWSPTGGLTLRRYFENACVLSFPNVYRKWQRARRDWQDVELLDGWAPVERYQGSRSTEDVVVGRVAVDALFEHLGQDAGTVLFLHHQNFSHAEIAELLRLTPRAVEGRLRRARQTARASILEGDR